LKKKELKWEDEKDWKKKEYTSKSAGPRPLWPALSYNFRPSGKLNIFRNINERNQIDHKNFLLSPWFCLYVVSEVSLFLFLLTISPSDFILIDKVMGYQKTFVSFFWKQRVILGKYTRFCYTLNIFFVYRWL
jgi:hypothetical protein